MLEAVELWSCAVLRARVESVVVAIPRRRWMEVMGVQMRREVVWIMAGVVNGNVSVWCRWVGSWRKAWRAISGVCTVLL